MRARNGKEEPYQQILHRLAHIEHKVDSIDETNAFALRAEAEKHQGTVKKIFKKSKRRAQVYLAADGTWGVAEIAKHLRMKQPNVSPDLRILKEEGLLELIDASGRQDFWAKKTIDKTLRISKYLCEEYSLKPDGRPNSEGKDKRRK
ncbi:MAG TPA: ArsR family transcriptional regulator [Terriglobia bacterium]|nr:ArsR family transcriptional regulator [Terriglobia bacterium]